MNKVLSQKVWKILHLDNGSIAIESDTTELARAEAEYNALKTEFDSVKSLIGDNVEKSFNLFS